MIDKNEEIEQPIPIEWRPLLAGIVEDIRQRKLGSKTGANFEISVDPDEIELIYESVESYGDPLATLPEESWQTSACRWMGSYWHLLIDLFTLDEGLSDLVLFVDVYEHTDLPCFKIRAVHVP